jgi:hypothetical protein
MKALLRQRGKVDTVARAEGAAGSELEAELDLQDPSWIPAGGGAGSGAGASLFYPP